MTLFIVRVAEGIGDEHAQLLSGGRPSKVEDFRKNAKLRNGEGAELHLESDDALESFVDGVGNSSFTLIGGDVLRDAAEDTERESPGSGSGVGDGDSGRGKATMEVEARAAERFVD